MTSPSRASLRRVINAHCKACIFDPYAKGCGSWREQVAACCSANCIFHPVRPMPRERAK